MAKIAYLAERVTADGRSPIAASKSLKKLYEYSKFHGRVADPSLSYKTVLRRLKTLEDVFFYDRVRFETESEAVYSPLMDTVHISRIPLL